MANEGVRPQQRRESVIPPTSRLRPACPMEGGRRCLGPRLRFALCRSDFVRLGQQTKQAPLAAHEALAADNCRARSALLAAELDGELVGRVSVRFALNDWLARQGGHIGYAVVPAFRRRGHATEMLRQALGIAEREGVAPLLVVCDNDKRCGGVFEGPATSEDGTTIRRYWI